MSFRTDLLAGIDAIRAIAGPDGFDIRTNRLTIRKRTWSGGRLSLGTATDVDLVLLGHYPIKYVDAHEVHSSGGVLELGDILVDHITPSDGTIGYTPTHLRPPITSNSQELIYILTGAHVGEYGLVEIRTYRPFTYQLALRRRGTTP